MFFNKKKSEVSFISLTECAHKDVSVHLGSRSASLSSFRARGVCIDNVNRNFHHLKDENVGQTIHLDNKYRTFRTSLEMYKRARFLLLFSMVDRGGVGFFFLVENDWFGLIRKN